MSKILMELGGRTVPEAILVEILARLPLRTIARSKSVCKGWKSLIESPYFRRLFVSLHRNSSSSWSLMVGSDYAHSIIEAIGFHGCETWDLPKSLGSYIMPFQRYPNLPASRYFYVASSNGLFWINVFFPRADHNMAYGYKSFVGNPVLEQWVEIPPPPDQCAATGLVTRLDEKGVVSGFKVVRTGDILEAREMGMYVWRVYVYSSETGSWTYERLLSSHPVNYNGSYPPANVDGKLYLWERGSDSTEPGVLVAHDFYSPEGDDRCLVIPLPPLHSKDVRRCLTTSGADVIYIEVVYSRLKVWRLNKNNFSGRSSSEWWRLSREEINMANAGFSAECFPMAMNPVDTDVVYLWSEQHECLVSSNLRTREFVVHQESESWSNNEGCWRINTDDSVWYVRDNRNASRVIMLSPFLLPRWMDSVPRPPN